MEASGDRMVIGENYDVVIAGGGLAGLSLAIQLKQSKSDVRVLVAEKSGHPLPEAAHKVGESSVEVGSHYFQHVLGLSELLENEVPKFGLRFFMSRDENRDLSTRLECGPSHFLYVPSFQIDRGQFENGLAARARIEGVDFADGCRVTSIDLGSSGADHRVGLARADGSFATSCRWFVDASGRASLLKKKLGLARSNRHDVNAVWFRIDHPIDIDDWSDDPNWRGRNKHSRRLSTNHLMGEGYWVWLIPLAKGRTSIGIVSEERQHPFSELHTFELAEQWLERHEPQCAAVVRRYADRRMDFRAIKNFSYDSSQAFSSDRWCLVGEAGVFVDPLYSPGSDFIGIANGFARELITRELDGDRIDEVAEVYDQVYRSLGRTYMMTYHRQYSLMGNGRVMSVKVVWDFAMYWGGIALVYFRDKFRDPEFLERVRPTLYGFAQLNVGMQSFFRRWAEEETGIVAPRGTFVDYAEVDFLAEMNRDLQRDRDDDALLEQLEQNLQLARELKREIVEYASAGSADLPIASEGASTSHLKDVFAAFRSVGA